MTTVWCIRVAVVVLVAGLVAAVFFYRGEAERHEARAFLAEQNLKVYKWKVETLRDGLKAANAQYRKAQENAEEYATDLDRIQRARSGLVNARKNEVENAGLATPDDMLDAADALFGVFAGANPGGQSAADPVRETVTPQNGADEQKTEKPGG